MPINSTHPLSILNEMDGAYKKTINKAPPLAQVKSSMWSGVGFRIASDELVIKNTYINEITNTDFQQNISSFPGSKSWLLGLISLRGQPLSVIDLKQYFFNKPTQQTPNNRLIVIKHENTIAGLLVEHVYGLKQFSSDAEDKEITEEEKKVFSSNIAPFINTIFDDNGIQRGNLSISQLVNDPDFANAAR